MLNIESSQGQGLWLHGVIWRALFNFNFFFRGLYFYDPVSGFEIAFRVETLTAIKPRVRVKLKTLAQIPAASTTSELIYMMGFECRISKALKDSDSG